jgi:hypothetical protein
MVKLLEELVPDGGLAPDKGDQTLLCAALGIGL